MAQKDEILARELGKLGAMHIAVSSGAQFVARQLADDIFEITLELAAPPDSVLQTACTILEQHGTIIEDAKEPSDLPGLQAIIGAGFFNLNPTLVSVEVAPLTAGATRVMVRGTAKEGLIKQHAGEQAARRVADMLVGMWSSGPDKGDRSESHSG